MYIYICTWYSRVDNLYIRVYNVKYSGNIHRMGLKYNGYVLYVVGIQPKHFGYIYIYITMNIFSILINSGYIKTKL